MSKAETSETLGHLGACPVPSLPVFDARVMNNDASVQLEDSSHLARKPLQHHTNGTRGAAEATISGPILFTLRM